LATEIERKFLVMGDDWCSATGALIWQGYLNRDKHRTVRVRVAGNQAFLTIKGATQGATRAEFEYAIPVTDATALRALCDGPIIEKVRRRIDYAGFTWELDEFFGDNGGLVVAEIELSSETEAFAKPPWAGQEVTEDARYFNSNLAMHPYSEWSETR
jgi:CYTH domain-containing protein